MPDKKETDNNKPKNEFLVAYANILRKNWSYLLIGILVVFCIYYYIRTMKVIELYNALYVAYTQCIIAAANMTTLIW